MLLQLYTCHLSNTSIFFLMISCSLTKHIEGLKVLLTCQDSGQLFFWVLFCSESHEFIICLFRIDPVLSTWTYLWKSARIIIFTAYMNRAFCDKTWVNEGLYHGSGIIWNYIFFACSCLDTFAMCDIEEALSSKLWLRKYILADSRPL